MRTVAFLYLTLTLCFTIASCLPTKPSFAAASTLESKVASPPLTASIATTQSLAKLRGGASPDEFASVAYDWCINLGAPAALVAGAVVATLYENVRSGALEVEENDSNMERLGKTLTSVLLLSAFACQIISIFVTTVTGTMLLSRDMSDLVVTSTTALGFLREHFEFEYLTARLSFLQGLLNWLGAVALEHTIPRNDQAAATRRMDRFVACSLLTCILMLVSFYDNHLTFYENYGHMVARWCRVGAQRFFFNFRPMMLLYVPGIAATVYSGVQALLPAQQDDSKGRGKK